MAKTVPAIDRDDEKGMVGEVQYSVDLLSLLTVCAVHHAPRHCQETFLEMSWGCDQEG